MIASTTGGMRHYYDHDWDEEEKKKQPQSRWWPHAQEGHLQKIITNRKRVGEKKEHGQSVGKSEIFPKIPTKKYERPPSKSLSLTPWAFFSWFWGRQRSWSSISPQQSEANLCNFSRRDECACIWTQGLRLDTSKRLTHFVVKKKKALWAPLFHANKPACKNYHGQSMRIFKAHPTH